MKKTIVRFTVSMPEDLRDAVKKLGDAETRNISDQVNVLVREALKQRGVPLANDHTSTLDLNSYLNFHRGQS